MKKFLSYFLSFTLLINLSAASCTFAANSETSKDQKVIVDTESKKAPKDLSNDNKNNKLSDEELKNQIIKLIENGEIKIPHKTFLDVLYKLLKTVLITAGSIISIGTVACSGLYVLTLNRLTKFSGDLVKVSENTLTALNNTYNSFVEAYSHFDNFTSSPNQTNNFNIYFSDFIGPICTLLSAIVIPIYKFSGQEVPDVFNNCAQFVINSKTPQDQDQNQNNKQQNNALHLQ